MRPTATLIMRDDVARAIRRAASQSPNTEICGLLMGRDGECVAHAPSPNRHPNAELGFVICDAVYARSQREARVQGQHVIGCYHSHPSGDTSPSQTDLHGINQDGFVWLIVAPDGSMAAWRASTSNRVKCFDRMTIELSLICPTEHSKSMSDQRPGNAPIV